jgi:hypothetical protein
MLPVRGPEIEKIDPWEQNHGASRISLFNEPVKDVNNMRNSIFHLPSVNHSRQHNSFQNPQHNTSFLERISVGDYHHPCSKYQTYMQDLKKQIAESKRLKAELQA